MRRLFWFVLLGFAAHAQTMLDGKAAEEARAAFATPEPSVLRCQFSKTPPALDYRFRFRVEFTVALPVDELRNARGWTLRLRVTPDGREPVFLSIADAKPESDGIFKADFAVGEGGYAIAAILRNELGGSCSSAWRADAHAKGPERAFDSPLAAGDVASTDAAPPPSAGLRHDGARVAILLDAASFVPGRAKLDEDDIRALSESLESLVERLPGRRLRLVVFRLDRRDPIFEDNDFTGDVSRAVKALRDAELAVVDYRSLRGSGDPVGAAVNLIRRELARPEPPAAMVVAGPYTPVPEGASEATPKRESIAARLFYLQYRRYKGPPEPRQAVPPQVRAGEAEISQPVCTKQSSPCQPPPRPPSPPAARACPIAQAVKALKGERLEIYGPRGFAVALRRIQQSF